MHYNKQLLNQPDFKYEILSVQQADFIGGD